MAKGGTVLRDVKVRRLRHVMNEGNGRIADVSEGSLARRVREGEACRKNVEASVTERCFRLRFSFCGKMRQMGGRGMGP